MYIRDNYVTKDTLVFSSQDDSLCINISRDVYTNGIGNCMLFYRILGEVSHLTRCYETFPF